MEKLPFLLEFEEYSMADIDFTFLIRYIVAISLVLETIWAKTEMSKAKKTVNAPTSFRLGEDLRSALKIIAGRESRSMANAIEWLAKDYFKQKKLDWPRNGQDESTISKEQ